MRHGVLIVGLGCAFVPGLIAAKTPSPAVSLDRALSMPAAELAATCNRAAAARKYIELARVGGSVTIGGRRVTARNADAVGAEVDAQLEVCRDAVAQRGVANIDGVWAGNSVGCDRAGSLLAQALHEPGTLVLFEQEGVAITMTLSGRTKDGQEFSFPAPGTAVEHYIAVLDPGNSDYVLQGEATDASIVLRPEAKSILAAWPAWADPPKPEDLASCAISLHRSTGDSGPAVAPKPYRNPYEGIPPSTSPFTDPSSLLPKAQARELDRTLESLWKARRLAISVLLMEKLQSESIEAFAKRVTVARGTGGARGGALLVLVHSDTSAYLAVGGDEAEVLTPDMARSIVERDVLPAMKAGNMYEAIRAGITSIVAALDGREPRP